MSIVFFGTPRFSVPALKKLLEADERISLVVTQADRIGGRGHRPIPPPVKLYASEQGIKVLQPESLRTEEFISALRDVHPEFIIVVAYGKILPTELLSLPERGCINLHASLLPKYRGAAPIQWAIINGESVTGVTTMLMDEGLDTGDILLQRKVPIRDDDNYLSLSERLADAGAGLLVETIRGMRQGIIKPTPQEGEPSYAPIIKREDGRINWHLSAVEIHNRVRGLYPWPCAFTYLRGRLLKILRTEVVDGSAEAGTVARKGKREFLVGTGRGLLSIRELQLEGRKPVKIEEFLNGVGRTLIEGERFDDGAFNEGGGS